MTRFHKVAALADEMAGTGSRLKKRADIAATIAQVHNEANGADLELFCLYLAGLPFPESDPRNLNAGGALLTKAVLAVSGAAQPELTAAYRRHGDLGASAFDLFVAHAVDTGEGVPLADVAETFAAMAAARVTAVRAALVEGLLRRASALEAKYLLKLMLGDMRIGVKQSLVEEAIAAAATASGQPAEVAAVRHAVMLEADLGHAAVRAFAGTLGEALMTLFHPLGFMLASPVETPEEAIERFTAKPPKPAPIPKKKRRKKGDPPEEPTIEPASTESDELLSEAAEAEASASSESSRLEAVQLPAQEIIEPEVQAFLEDKYDGMRAQIHCADPAHPGRVAIYSRNRDDITEGFPELVEAFAEAQPPSQPEAQPGLPGGLIFDGEILGWDYPSAQALPFAVLGQRIGRKRVGDDIRRQIPVVFMAFDLMFAAGELLLPQPLRERRLRLEAVVQQLAPRVQSPLILGEAAARKQASQATIFPIPEAEPGSAASHLPRLMISPARLVQTAEEIDRAYADARARANEGVMLKSAASAYLPGRRGLAWVKLKRELATLDVVITGAEYGSGRRAQSLSDYTFAVQDEHGDLQNVGKAYSGVTDLEVAELTEFLKAHTLEDHGHFRTVEPLVILEVAFNNIMRSDRHASGFALRFPRILRLRPDKPLAEIDTVARVEEIYQSQVDKPAG